MLDDLCVCPRCRGALSWQDRVISCAGCGAGYAVVDGIPVFTSSLDDGGDAYKREQAEFFDTQPAEWEITRPIGAPALYGWLMQQKFSRSVQGLEGLLGGGATVLTVCGGSGMDAEFLARMGARVIASDISPGAALRTRERAARHGVTITPIVADAESLPFASRTIDVTYVHDGLHHLEQPMIALREMARVARLAVSVTEPTPAAATMLAVHAGIAEIEEEAGNEVRRLAPSELTGELEQLGFHVTGWERYAMYYRHEPGPAMRVLSRRGLLRPARMAYTWGNRVLGPAGNKLSVRAVRVPAAAAVQVAAE